MTAIHLQLQPARSPSLDYSAIVGRLSSLDASARVSEGDDDGHYINIVFTPSDAGALWQAVRAQLAADRDLALAAIVACEGQQRWDDYLLLHHFDPAVPLDEFAEFV